MQFESIKKAILQRHSTYPKQFSGEKILDEDISDLLELANWAPTHKLTEPWRFKVFKGKSLLELLKKKAEWAQESISDDDKLHKKLEKLSLMKTKCSHIVAIVNERHDGSGIPEWEEIAATSMAVHNITLGFESKNVVGYWSSGNGTDSGIMRKHLKLTAPQKHLGWLILGKPIPKAITPNRVRKPLSDKVVWM